MTVRTTHRERKSVERLEDWKNEVRRQFGNRVRELRHLSGESQEGLALTCELDRSYIGQVERGERNLSLENIHRLAKALGVEAFELLLPVGAPSSVGETKK